MREVLMNDLIGNNKRLSDGTVLKDYRHSYVTDDDLTVAYCQHGTDEWDVVVVDSKSNLDERFSSDETLLTESKYLCDTITDFFHDGIFLMMARKTPPVPDSGNIFPPSWYTHILNQEKYVCQWLKQEYPELVDYPLHTYFSAMWYRFLAEQNRLMIDYPTGASSSNILGKNKFLFPVYRVCQKDISVEQALKEVDYESVSSGDVDSDYVSKNSFDEFSEDFTGFCAFQNYLKDVMIRYDTDNNLGIWLCI